MSSDTGMPCLDIVAGPGGAMYGADLKNGNVIRVMHPKNGEGAMDVFPWRGIGGVHFYLSGEGFS